MKKFEIIYKHVGETPLEALERFRAERIAAGHTDVADIPMTYAGRLDPMAEGELLILLGEECKQKEKYLGLDKEYEIEVVYGIQTDTHDALGLVTVVDPTKNSNNLPLPLEQYVGLFMQEYPAYSSRTVNGKQLHELARAGELPEEMPTKEVEIYSIELLRQEVISGKDLKSRISEMIGRVNGDFRQEEIMVRWNEVLADNQSFPIAQLRVSCSSGTYMRSLAQRIGGFALTIRRTKIFLPK
ncbi:MAG TPA: hypothetical protein VF438_01885 [Candidatus Paceibacterota bacterium]